MHRLHHPSFWVLAAFVLRLLYLTEQSANSHSFYTPVLDEMEASSSAQHLLAGEGFGPEPFFKAPLYTAYLAACMGLAGDAWPWLARFLQHLAGALVVGMAFSLTRSLCGGRSLPGVVTALLLTFCGPLIRLENRLVLDSLVVFFQTAMLWALFRAATPTPEERRWYVLAGIFAALAWLTRPTILLVIPCLALVVLRLDAKRWCWKNALAFLLPFVLSVGAVGVRNGLVADEWTITPWQGGYNFYHANRRGANGRYLVQEQFQAAASGNPTRELMLDAWQRAHPGQALRFQAVHRWWMGRGFTEFRQDPVGRTALLVRKAVNLLSQREVYNFEDFRSSRDRSWILRLSPIGAGILVPGAFLGLVLLPRTNRRGLVLLLVYTLVLAAAICLFYVSGRMRMPLLVPWAVLTGSGAAGFRFAAVRRKAASILLAALGVVVAWGDWWGVRSEDFRYLDYARFAQAAWAMGDPEESLHWIARVEQVRPDHPELPLLRGLAQHALGDVPAAIASFKSSLHLLPLDPVAPFNLGMIAWEAFDDLQEADDAFRLSLQRSPHYLDARWMLTRVALARCRTEDAHDWLEPGLARGGFTAYHYLLSVALYHRATGNIRQFESAANALEARYGEPARKALEREWERIQRACQGPLSGSLTPTDG